MIRHDESIHQLLKVAENALDEDPSPLSLLRIIRSLRRDLSIIEDDLVRQLADGHRNNEVICDGAATVKWAAASVEWDRDAARRAILALEQEMAIASGEAAVNPETGEKVATWQQAVDVVSRYWLLGNPRTTPMNEAGLDPADFRTINHRKPRIEFA